MILSILVASLLAPPEAAPPPRPVVAAVVASTLRSATGGIRQFAFDGDPESAFASAANPTAGDSLTLTFDAAVRLDAASVSTGRPDGSDALASGELEVSYDGTQFERLATFRAGRAESGPAPRPVLALRVRPGARSRPLVVRDIVIRSTPQVERFRYPVEIALDVSDAPELRTWAEGVVRVCEREYPMICDELASPGYRPRTAISMSFKNDYDGVAYASGDRIVGAVRYFKSHPKDVGAMVHETAHCVQGYRARRLPGWLVEGVADYVRYRKFEPQNARTPRAGRARYDGSYGTTAAFLKSVSDRYDPFLVRKLNALMRDGKYDPAAWRKLTGKTVEGLGQEWKQSLAE